MTSTLLAMLCDSAAPSVSITEGTGSPQRKGACRLTSPCASQPHLLGCLPRAPHSSKLVPARGHQQRGQTVPIAMIADPVCQDAVGAPPSSCGCRRPVHQRPSSNGAITLLFGGAAVVLISTAVEAALGALGIGGGAEAAASAAVRMTAEAAAGGADVAVGASVADVAAALEASAVADIGVAGGAQMGEAVAAIGGAQAAEVVTQAAGVTDVLVDGVAATSLAAVADVVGTDGRFAGLAAFNGLAPWARACAPRRARRGRMGRLATASGRRLDPRGGRCGAVGWCRDRVRARRGDACRRNELGQAHRGRAGGGGDD